MPRIRSIKPDFFKDEDLCQLPVEARLFFAGLWCQADRNGVVEYRPKRLKLEIMPYDVVDVEAIISMLEKPKVSREGKTFVTIFDHDGQKYIQIVGWSKHQKPHHLEKPILPTKHYKPLINDKTGTEPVLDQTKPASALDGTRSNPLVSCFLSLGSGNGLHESGDQTDHAFQKLLEVYPESLQQIGVQDGTAAVYFREEVIVADHGPILQAAKNYAASEQVAKGFGRQIINFLKGSYWRNWTDVKPSGAEYVPDRSLYEERDKMAKEQAERDAAGIPRGPQRRPKW